MEGFTLPFGKGAVPQGLCNGSPGALANAPLKLRAVPISPLQDPALLRLDECLRPIELSQSICGTKRKWQAGTSKRVTHKPL